MDTVEELVVKDGQNLEQSLHSGEEELGKWDELNEEEVRDIGAELRQNLQNLAEYLNVVDGAFKEEFKKHAAFVTDAIWVQLLKIICHCHRHYMDSVTENNGIEYKAVI